MDKGAVGRLSTGALSEYKNGCRITPPPGFSPECFSGRRLGEGGKKAGNGGPHEHLTRRTWREDLDEASRKDW